MGIELYWYVAAMPGGGRWPFRIQFWRRPRLEAADRRPSRDDFLRPLRP